MVAVAAGLGLVFRRDPSLWLVALWAWLNLLVGFAHLAGGS